MGLQYVDGRGFERTLTVEDMLTQDFGQAFSDLYKGLHGFRPGNHTPEQMLHFFDTYEVRFQESETEEQRLLDARSERDGVQYTSWSHYYDVREARDHARWVEEEARRQAELAERREFNRRGSPLPVITLWEHGAI